MAQHISAKKRIRRNANREEINRTRLSRVRTFVRKIETALLAGDAAAAREALHLATPEMHRAAAKHTMHHNTVNRKMSRLTKRIKALEVTSK